MTNSIILFDGICNLCNNWVNFIIERDKKKKFNFTALQSDSGQKLLHKFNIPAGRLGTFILIEQDRLYQKSTAALKVFQKIGGIWILLYIFIFIPQFIRDIIYDLVARNRYRWFGKQEKCIIPTEDIRNRFL